MEERAELASRCRTELRLERVIVVDPMDNSLRDPRQDPCVRLWAITPRITPKKSSPRRMAT